MNSSAVWTRIGIGTLVGAAIALIDNFAFGGETSPIVIVGMLLIVGATVAWIWGSRGVIAAAAAWIWLPMAHVLKHVLGLPDTLHPNTWASILKLGVFTLIVTGVGLGIGLVLRKTFRSHPVGAA